MKSKAIKKYIFETESYCSECTKNEVIYGVGKYPLSLLETKRLYERQGLRLTETESGVVFLLLPTSRQNYQLLPCNCGRMIRIEIQKPAEPTRLEVERPLKNSRRLPSRNHSESGIRKSA